MFAVRLFVLLWFGISLNFREGLHLQVFETLLFCSIGTIYAIAAQSVPMERNTH
jgi:hypothetical protein